MKIHLLIILVLSGLIGSSAAAVTMGDVAGIYVGHRIERLVSASKEVRHYDEISIYRADGTFLTRLEAQDGTVYLMQGAIHINPDGSWDGNNGPHYRADFRGNTLIVFVDWRPYGIGVVVQSMTHRVEALPDSSAGSGTETPTADANPAPK